MKKIACSGCHYTWEPRVKNPKQCPSCKKPRYAELKKAKVILKTCKITNCDKPVRARGYCVYHYNLHGNDTKPCGVVGCENNYYAKGHCRKHYAYYAHTPLRRHLGQKCKAPNCDKNVSSINQYCPKHKRKKEKGLDLSKNCSGEHWRGPKNPNWKGGVSDYPNHHQMKKIRKEKIKEVGKCEDCGTKSKKLEVHHLDKSKTNHAPENLRVVCHKCHVSLYHRDVVGRKPNINRVI